MRKGEFKIAKMGQMPGDLPTGHEIALLEGRTDDSAHEKGFQQGQKRRAEAKFRERTKQQIRQALEAMVTSPE